MSNYNGFSIALIVASKGRFPSLTQRIPIWAKAGFDEVIIVGKYNVHENKALMDLCSKHNVTYITEPTSWVDTRSKQRNIGAKKAKTEWLLFGDDDDDIIAEIDQNMLEMSAKGNDWLVGKSGSHIVYHRRKSFLNMGGYPEDMVAAEDEIMSNRARRFGIGGYEGMVYKKVISSPPSSPSYWITRATNHFWYGFTFLILFFRTPQPTAVVTGEIRRFGKMFLLAVKGDFKNFIFMFIRVFGYFLSIFHILRILLHSGFTGLKREPYASWQGLRSTDS